MHDNGTQTIKEVMEPIIESQEVCKEEANTSSSHSPSPRTVYTFNDGKVGLQLHAVLRVIFTCVLLKYDCWCSYVHSSGHY